MASLTALKAIDSQDKVLFKKIKKINKTRDSIWLWKHMVLLFPLRYLICPASVICRSCPGFAIKPGAFIS